MLANRCHRDDKGYSNPWMPGSSHQLLSGMVDLTSNTGEEGREVHGKTQAGTKLVFR